MFVRRHARHRSPRHSRALIAAGAVAITVTVAAGTMVSASASEVPTVTLTVDGQSTSFTTTDPTVGAVLSEHNIVVDSNDLVTPTPPTDVSNGTDITVDHRVQVTLKDSDGARSTHLVDADTVNQLKTELGLPTVDLQAMRQSANQPISWKRTLVLRPNGKQIMGRDRLVDGSTASVLNVRVAFRTDTVRLHPKLHKHHTALLPSGTVKVKQRGHAGRVTLTVRRKFVNSELVRRDVLHRVVHRPVHNRIVLVGTGPNWHGLANCESGNNPRAVNPAGFYGLYQFSLSTWAGVGGHGNPVDASRAEQTKRAWILFKRAGSSPWPVCGVYL